MSVSDSLRMTRRPDAAQRGSVLLMVVAVLALLAIIAVAYTTLGRADRAASASLVRESRLDDQAAFFKDYLSGVIAGDVLAIYSERRGDGSWATWREATDVPGTDILALSRLTALPGGNDGAYRFVPTGSYFGRYNGTGLDVRRPCDPWLASIEPEELPPDGMLASTGVFALPDLQKRRTWRSISNFAPDGRFVNLVGLRPGGAGFQADPLALTAGLSVYDDMGNPSLQDPYASANVEYFRPSDFSTWQHLAFRPMFDNRPPSDPFHINNQWADADGDGFADSRWFELVDAFDPSNIRWLLPQTGRARMFLAARAIDLSGLINVNTAGDFYYEPRATVNANNELVHYPAGLTPADVDLRRFLGMGDMTWTLRGSGNVEYGYDQFAQGPGVADYSGYDAALAISSGNTAYAAIRYAINTGEVLPSDARRTGPSNEPRLAWNTSEAALNPINPNPLTDELRARFYEEFGADPASARNRAVGGSFVYRAPFGLADELELRTFSGVNDSDHLSPLERVPGGREDRRFGPMRENRPRAVEMTGRPDSASGLASDEALLSVFADIRHLLTTQSSARTIVDNPLAIVNPSVLSALEYKTDMVALLNRISQPLVTPVASADIQAIFDLYSGSLAPYAERARYPAAWDLTQLQHRGLSYGESAELAQRISAHMTANLLDAADQEIPAAATYDRATPTRICLEAVTAAPTHMDFETSNIVAMRDIRRPAVGNTTEYVGPPRLNIYGIEAQPFVIEVGWFGMFTDAPVGATVGGAAPDNDFLLNQIPPVPPQTEPTLGPITIDDSPNSTNSDFMFEVLAFQLTNPFDRPIRLSTGGQVEYYIEYSNRFFALAKRSDTGDSIDTADVEIAPYETKVFYVTNIKDPQDIAVRLIAAKYTAPGSTPAAVLRTYVDDWAQRQFGLGAVPIPMVHRKTFTVCDSAGGTGGGGAEFVDIFAETTVPAGGPGEPAQGPISSPPSSLELRKVANLWRVFRPAAATDPAGDILLDRIRDPDAAADGTIASYRSGSGNVDVPNTLAGNDDDSDPNNDQDNTGFSITKWAGFRRPNNQSGVPYQRGSMPPWCIEAKSINEYTISLNKAYDEPAGGIGDGGDYRGNTQDERRTTLEGLMTAQLNAATVNSQMLAKAENKVGNEIPANNSVPAKPFKDVAVEMHIGGGTHNPQLFSRAGDFLLPLGIGPSYNPLAMAAQPSRAQGLEKSWMTLSEALALSCDYYNPTFAEDPLLYRLGHSEAGASPIRPRLDRGNLVLNDFAPYLDLGGTAGAFDPDVDEPLGRGVPLALNILDMVNTTDRWKLGTSGLVRRTQAHGGPRTGIHGLININTAPASVLRMVPLFAPDTDDASWTRTSADVLYDKINTTFDIAATAVAYRDKTILTTRPTTTAANRRVINFRDDNDTDPGTFDGRFDQTGIAAIREQPGIKSVGEIMALRLRDFSSGNRLYENSIDRFADDTGTPARQPKKSLESVLWKDPTGNTYDVDQLVNDYDEQLAIANAAMNSISVRSDVFCVWFLIHGYLPSDVENLGPNDPMIPSIARRYVMVVDRSNVTQLGQKPQILLFQEVPIR